MLERVPGVRVPGEAVQEQERGPALTTPVQEVEPPARDGQVTVPRP